MDCFKLLLSESLVCRLHLVIPYRIRRVDVGSILCNAIAHIKRFKFIIVYLVCKVSLH